MQKSLNVEEVLDAILAKDARYHRDAYYFVRDALDVAQKKFAKAASRAALDKPSHVSGQQLLEGIRTHALEQFGPLTLMVLEEWGLRRCEDFGEIVFNMVESSLLGKTESDSRDDFKGGYDFYEAFRKPYLPKAKLLTQKPKVEEVG
ncbi:MAG: Minf_1886 family protein [Limisphaerales bacterium]